MICDREAKISHGWVVVRESKGKIEHAESIFEESPCSSYSGDANLNILICYLGFFCFHSVCLLDHIAGEILNTTESASVSQHLSFLATTKTKNLHILRYVDIFDDIFFRVLFFLSFRGLMNIVNCFYFY